MVGCLGRPQRCRRDGVTASTCSLRPVFDPAANGAEVILGVRNVDAGQKLAKEIM